MKTKSIITSIAITMIFSCGPSKQEKEKMEYEEQKAQEQKAEEEYMNNMSSIQTLQGEATKSMTYIKDTVVKYMNGRIYVPSDEIWEVKLVVMVKDSIDPPVECECPVYQKNMESSTSTHDAIVNGRCIKFDGAFEVNENGQSSYATRLLNVTRPKYVPADIDITPMKQRALVIRRNKITDMEKMNEIKRLVELTKTNPNHLLLKDYYYTHCFNDAFELTPVSFGKCNKIVD